MVNKVDLSVNLPTPLIQLPPTHPDGYAKN